VETHRTHQRVSERGDEQEVSPKKGRKKYPPIWRFDAKDGYWLMLPQELVLRPHHVHPSFRPRHLWFVMRLMAQPMRDYLGDCRIRATYSQLRNAASRDDARNAGKKLRAKKGEPSYDAIRRWAAELKRFGLITWVPGGKVGGVESASVFDLSKLADRVQQLRLERAARPGE
jgi:hypothetical protein